MVASFESDQNPEYANIEILEVAPPEVLDFPNAVFAICQLVIIGM